MLRAYARAAERLYPYRRRFALVTVVGFVALFLAMLSKSKAAVNVLGVAAGPVVFLPWGIYLLCVWFHPVHGIVSKTSFGRLSQLARSLKKVLLAAFLAAYMTFALIGLPMFSIWSHAATCAALRLFSVERCTDLTTRWSGP